MRDSDALLIDAIEHAGPWAKFRIDDPCKCLALLRQLRVGDVRLRLGLPRGTALWASLWAIDDPAARLYFSADAADPALPALLGQPGLWAAAELADTKLQFAVDGLTAAAAAVATGPAVGSSVRLQASLPSHVYSLPRRRAQRLRQSRHRSPRLRFRHPLAPDTVLVLPALDISSEGCAMWKPASELPLLPGELIERVEVQLDADTVLFTDLMVQHVTRQSDDPDSGARVGCSWAHMPASGRDDLQRWLQSGRGQSTLISLALD